MVAVFYDLAKAERNSPKLFETMVLWCPASTGILCISGGDGWPQLFAVKGFILPRETIIDVAIAARTISQLHQMLYLALSKVQYIGYATHLHQ